MADTYNYDMQRLQQDAIRRAREMQSRAQAAVSQPNRNTPNPVAPNYASHSGHHSAPSPQRTAAPPPHPPAVKLEQPVVSNDPGRGQMAPIRDVFDILFSDTERTLILVLILLLVEEQADTGLIFALLYLVI